MSHHVDRWQAALTVLAGHGYIKQRLIEAYENHLDEIDEQDLPRSSRPMYAALRQTMHRVSPDNGESRVCASVRKMSVDEASACAAQIVDLYARVATLADAVAVAIPMREEPGTRVPPFLVESV